MRVFLLIWKTIGPLVLIGGILYFCLVLFNSDWTNDFPLEIIPTCICGGVCTIVGIILGFTGWAEEVAPRMFWVKSRIELLDNKLGYALTIGIQMFFLPAAIVLTLALIGAI